jgi:hypothetical protein
MASVLRPELPTGVTTMLSVVVSISPGDSANERNNSRTSCVLVADKTIE